MKVSIFFHLVFFHLLLHLPDICPSEDALFSRNDLMAIKESAFCYQQRSTPQTECDQALIKDFCSHVQCEPVNCDEINEERVEGLIGHGCCAACIKSLPFNAPCTPGHVLEQCKNGLVCSLSKHRCDLPREASMPCLTDYQNRNNVRGKSFYIRDPKSDKVVALPYATDEMVMPVCSSVDGSYMVKQTTPSKAYCVDTQSGEALFGVVDRSHMTRATCRCTQAMTRLFRQRDTTAVQREIFKDTHIRCASTGNFAGLSCVNETCLCLDESTGQPKTHVFDYEHDDPSLYDDNGEELVQNARLHAVRFPSVVTFGALAALSCFDEERGKLKGKDAKEYYSESCQKEMHRMSLLEEYFLKKGTKIVHNTAYPCGFDDRFDRKQCKDGSCRCSSPDGVSLGSFSVDKSRGSEMNCRCAIEQYLSKSEKKSFDNVECSQEGNFNPIQRSYQQGNKEKGQCFDVNGMPISKEFTCEAEFLARWGFTDMQTICKAMADAIKNDHPSLSPAAEIYFDANKKTYDINPNNRKPSAINLVCQNKPVST